MNVSVIVTLNSDEMGMLRFLEKAQREMLLGNAMKVYCRTAKERKRAAYDRLAILSRLGFIAVDYGGHEPTNPAFVVLDPNEPVEIVSLSQQ